MPRQTSDRQRLIRELVGAGSVANQQEIVEQLGARGFGVTQATVSRDIAQLGLIKVPRDNRHVYVLPEDVAAPQIGDDRLRRVLNDLPVSVRRSGLTLLLVSTPGSAPAIAEAIDRSNLNEQEGTLAGDNTVLVLFADEPRLESWRAKLRALQPAAPRG